MLKTVSSIANAIGALNYKGTWDANANNPTLASSVGTKGDYYVVGTAGSTNLNGISNWGIGDWAVFNGSVWQRVEGGADLNGVNLSVSGTVTFATPLAIANGGTNSIAMPTFRASCSAQTFTTAVETKVQFSSVGNTNEWNIGGYFNTSTYKFLPLVAGYYFVKAQLFWGTSVLGRDQIAIFKNGSAYNYTLQPGSNITGGQTHSVTATVFLNGSTDFVEIYAVQNSGVDVAINTSLSLTNFEAHWVRSA
jgi:hypothetical protein